MPDVIAPARVEFVLVYACPACGKESLLRAKEAGALTTCRHCQAAYQPQALDPKAQEAMLRAYALHQPPAPRALKVAGLRGMSFTLADSFDLTQFTTLTEVDLLHGKLASAAASGQAQELLGRPILLHGTVREATAPGRFTFAVIESASKRTEAFLEFPGTELDPQALLQAGHICVLGVCNGLMGSHNPLALWCSDCRVVGVLGQPLPPGKQVEGALFDIPPNTPRNPLDAHFIFQAAQPGKAQTAALKSGN